MQEAASWRRAMVATLGLTREQVLNACAAAKDAGVVEPANFNCPGQICIIWPGKGSRKGESIAIELGAKSRTISCKRTISLQPLASAGEKLRWSWIRLRYKTWRFLFLQMLQVKWFPVLVK